MGIVAEVTGECGSGAPQVEMNRPGRSRDHRERVLRWALRLRHRRQHGLAGEYRLPPARNRASGRVIRLAAGRRLVTCPSVASRWSAKALLRRSPFMGVGAVTTGSEVSFNDVRLAWQVVDFRIFTEPQQGASYHDLLGVARTVEDAGYDAFFRSDHYLKMGRSPVSRVPPTPG